MYDTWNRQSAHMKDMLMLFSSRYRRTKRSRACVATCATSDTLIVAITGSSSPLSTPTWPPHAFMSPQTQLAQNTGVPQVIAMQLSMSDKGRPNSQYPECSLICSGPVWW